MKNAYEIRGDTTAVFINSPKYGAMETLIATVDTPRAHEFLGSWFPLWCRGTQSFYVRGKLHRDDGTYGAISLHRWIMRVDDSKLDVDHILHDTLDNCRWSLNVVTHAQNSQNARLSARNKSGYPGVSWNARLCKWKAHIRVNYKLTHLGYYGSKEEAISSRKAAEESFYDYKRKIN